MEQQPLDFPARRSDPPTSRIAAAEMVLSGARETQQRAVLALVRKHPGRTVQELARLSGNVFRCPDCGQQLPSPRELTRSAISRRMTELERDGVVEADPEIRRCEVTGRLARAWRLSDWYTGKERRTDE